jgi:hypothetical protein
MENTGIAEEKIRHVTEYLDVQVQMVKLKAVDKASGLASDTISVVVIGLVALMAVSLLTIATAFYFSHRLGSHTKGFLLVGGIYLVVCALLFLFRKPLIANGIRNRMIASLLSDKKY